MEAQDFSETNWSRVTAVAAAKQLNTNTNKGLSEKEAESRIQQYGENVFEGEEEPSIIERVAKQIFSPLVLILLAAGVVTIVLQSYLDATVIFIAFAINVVIGVVQEERASKSFEKLRASQEKHATVLRDGKKEVIPAEKLVPGDIVHLEAGSYVPADIRLLHTGSLEINEAALTGEWVGVEKNEKAIKEEVPISVRSNMAWMGTLISGGFGKGIVVATGEETQIGHIAGELSKETEVQTPIQRNIRRLAVFISYLVVAVVGIIFFIGVLRGQPINEMLLVAVAVAVSVVPEGLPVAVTIVLAFGMERILKAGGLVRNLLAAETLGGTTLILTDKTGTLTQAKMHLDEVITLGGRQKGIPKDGIGKGVLSDAQLTLRTAALASDAFVEEVITSPGRKDGRFQEERSDIAVRGRPMERAVILASVESGLVQEGDTEKGRIDFLAFDSERRYAASLNAVSGRSEKRLYVTGSPEHLMEHADRVLHNGKEEKITRDVKEYFAKALTQVGSEGSRSLGVAYKDVSWNSFSEVQPKTAGRERETEPIESVIFAGLLVFSDPIREDVAESIEKAKSAGARVVMVTGDNPETAMRVARDAGVAGPREKAILGKDIEKMDDKDLLMKLKKEHIFARILPSQKLRIAKLLRGSGEVVAMTGDGINDAPALRNADIGVAVGSGTEVAKEASDLILVENSFSIIVAAIEEGRRIIDNLKKIVTHLLSTSFHEVVIIAAAMLFGLPLPILPAQILWANIIEEGLLNFGFAFEPGERGLMKRDPRSERVKNILTPQVRKLILIAGTITSIFTLGLFLVLLLLDLPIKEIRTIIFVVLSLDSIFFAISLKNLHGPFWNVNFFSNRYLLFALGVSILLLLATLSVPALRTLLSLTTLNAFEILLLAGIGAFNLATIEFAKRFVFGKDGGEEPVVSPVV